MEGKEDKNINPTQLEGEAKKKGPSKKELNKMRKKAAKEAKKLEAQRLKAEAQKLKTENAKQEEKELVIPTLTQREGNVWGELEIVQSGKIEDIEFTELKDLNKEMDGKTVWLRARIQNSRVTGKVAFMVLRQRLFTLQTVSSLSETLTADFLTFLKGIPKESIVDIKGKIMKVSESVKSCSIQDIELHVESLILINRTMKQLPFEMKDASRKMDLHQTAIMDKEEEGEGDADNKESIVGLKTRLDNRIIDLRTPANQGIFRVQSAVCTLYREFLLSQGFIEIHTPKLLGGASEGGSNVFKFDYFGKSGCLAQSPQLYKQMMIMADFEKVFEIGPVFRAENSNTHRHLCEFTGLDGEMEIKQHYFEVLDVIGNLFNHMFKGLETRYAKELAVINEQFEFEPFKFLEEPLKLTFAEGVALLKEAGVDQDPHDDLSTETEKILGGLVREKYNTDFYMLHQYPEEARPFYTMLDKEDPRFTCSYDVFMRGEEIISGAQRIHDPVLLAKRAEEKGIEVASIQDYIDSFSYGAYPHGGWGVGLERVVMLYLNVGNVRRTSAFPRDPKRISP